MLTVCIDRFNQLYADESTCIALIHKLRWPTGFQCTRCDHNSAYRINTRRLPLFECRRCNQQTSLTSGTVMHKSRTPLRKWLLTMYIVATYENSINATDLSALLSVTYKTAWSMLKKIRYVISEADRKTLLSGIVEARPVIYMEQPIPTYERMQQEKTAIVARTIPNNQPSYFKIKLFDRTTMARDNLTWADQDQFAKEHISSELTHLEMNIRKSYRHKCQSSLPNVAKQAFRWLNNTFHGLALTYSQTYLDEYCFRLNFPKDGRQCPFDYLIRLCLKAIHIEEPANYYEPEPPPYIKYYMKIAN